MSSQVENRPDRGVKMKIVKVLSSVLLAGVFLAVSCKPVVAPSNLNIPSVSGGELSNPKHVMEGYYEAGGLSLTPNAPGYLLPLERGR